MIKKEPTAAPTKIETTVTILGVIPVPLNIRANTKTDRTIKIPVQSYFLFLSTFNDASYSLSNSLICFLFIRVTAIHNDYLRH